MVLTSGSLSPCTMQTSIASWPSPEKTTGVSTDISGGSATRNLTLDILYIISI